MRLFGSSYRHQPQFRRRRIERIAGEMNVFLIVVAIGLAMLDLFCLGSQLVDSMSSQTQVHAALR